MAFVAHRHTPGPASADVRSMIGRRIHADTLGGRVTGHLLSCTVRSLWIVDADDDVVIPLDEVIDIEIVS